MLACGTPAGPTGAAALTAPAHRMTITPDTIIDIVARTCGIEPGQVRLDATLKEMDVRSLGAVQVLFEIEDRFKVHVPERDERYAAGTVRDLVAGVERLLAAQVRAT